MRQDAADPVGQWRRQFDGLAPCRVNKGEPRRVKRDAPQALNEIGRQRGMLPGGLGAVRLVSHEWVTERRQMDADLMGAARLEPALEIRIAVEPLERAEARHGALAGARGSQLL